MDQLSKAPETAARIENPETEAFRRWLRWAKAGETYLYYVGHLAEARMEMTTQPELASDKSYDWSKGSYTYYVWREPLHGYASDVYAAYENGDVLLTQRKRPDGRYDYLATKAKMNVNKRRFY